MSTADSMRARLESMWRTRGRMSWGRVAAIVAVLLIVFWVAYPILTVLIRSVYDPETGRWSMEALRGLLTPKARGIYLNTVMFVAFSVLGAFAIALALALAVTRVQLSIPSKVLQLLPVISLFLPPLLGALGWLFLFAPRTGLINGFLRDLLGLDPDWYLISAYDVKILFLVSAVYLVPYIYVILVAGLENMDGSLEDAARVSGDSVLRVVRKVTLPVMIPSITSALLLSLVLAMSEFSIPVVLGKPAGFEVVTLSIWRAVQFTPVDRAFASAIGVTLLIATLIPARAQFRAVRKSGAKFHTVAGKGSAPRKIRVRPIWSYLILTGIFLYVLVAVVLPILALAITSVQPFWGQLDTSFWANKNYTEVFANRSSQLDSLRNSTILGFLGATLGVVICFFIAYTIARTKVKGRKFLQAISMAPSGTPHILLGFGFLLMFLQPMFRPLYGTIAGILIAYIVIYIPHGTRASEGVLHQIHPELEEASTVSGAGRFRTLARVVVPLSARGLFAAWTLLFALMFREVSASVFLATTRLPVVSARILSISEAGLYPQLAALGILMLAVNLIVVIIGQSFIGGRQGRKGRRGSRDSPYREASLLGGEAGAQVPTGVLDDISF